MTALALGIDLPWWGWAVAVAAALVMGFSKTAIGNMALVGVVALAQLLPAKDSTGAALLMLLMGDAVAVIVYRHHADWRLIGRLLLPVALGLGLGAAFLHAVPDTVLKKTIGVILLALLLLGLRPDKFTLSGRTGTVTYGGLAGFTTMVANAGGPAMSLYLLAARFDKMAFLGTTAWFFAAVNLAKLPISIGLGIVRPDLALFALVLAPAVLAGTWLGRWLVGKLNQATFNRLVMIFVAVSAVYLIVA
jgi:uncharacterized membrane protein YfcA